MKLLKYTLLLAILMFSFPSCTKYEQEDEPKSIDTVRSDGGDDIDILDDEDFYLQPDDDDLQPDD